jgi:hypothetical protein
MTETEATRQVVSKSDTNRKDVPEHADDSPEIGAENVAESPPGSARERTFPFLQTPRFVAVRRKPPGVSPRHRTACDVPLRDVEVIS